MKKIRCFLVDDEPPAIQLLEKYIGMVDKLEVVGIANNAVKAFELLQESTPDLIFLDIRMPLLNGIDFIKTLKQAPPIIFTTAYREYAVESYDLDVVDYLLKPISFERFLKAVDRFSNGLKQEKKEQKHEVEENEHIYLNINRTHHKLFIHKIIYVESLKDYVRVHTEDEKLVVKGNLGSFMKLIPTDKIVRIHRSFAVSLSHIKSYNQREIDVAIATLPIGISYRNILKGGLL